MKYVINKDYGGFNVDESWLDDHNINLDTFADELRAHPMIIEAIENGDEDIDGIGASLKVVEIPDNATDWELDEYDGWESIIAVVDGKIIHL